MLLPTRALVVISTFLDVQGSYKIDPEHLKKFPNCGTFSSELKCSLDVGPAGSSRIAGGKTGTRPVPWLAYLFVVMETVKKLPDGSTESGFKTGKCHGSLISPNSVLTAGHCICDPDDYDLSKPESSVADCLPKPTDNQLAPDQKREIWMMFNTLQFTIQQTDDHRVPDEGFILLPHWTLSSDVADVGILKFKDRIGYDPICLPASKSLDLTRTALVIGWGARVEKSSSCNTDIHGPVMQGKCDPGVDCKPTDPPGIDKTKCDKLLQMIDPSRRRLFQPGMISKFTFTEKGKGPKTVCYNGTLNKYGWCNAGKKGWGFCNKHCSLDPDDAAFDYEIAELHLMPDRLARPAFLDGYQKVEIPLEAELEITNQIADYKRVEKRTGQPPSPKYGNALPCVGDSGAPLFYEGADQQVNNPRFVQIGIMSGTNGFCGDFGDEQASFVKVENVLDWIKSTAQF